jgi:hypothetical protein
MPTPERSLSNWLRGRPGSLPPASVRCTTPEGVRTVVIDTSTKGPFARAVRVIVSMHAGRIEALDKDGNVLRVTEVEYPEETEGEEEPEEEPAQVIVPNSEKESQLVLVASLLKDAYTTGAQQSNTFANDAFQKLCAITETAFKRLDSLERLVTRTFQQAAKATRDEDEPEDPLTKMVGAIMQGRAAAEQAKQAATPAATPPAPANANGAATHEGS